MGLEKEAARTGLDARSFRRGGHQSSSEFLLGNQTVHHGLARRMEGARLCANPQSPLTLLERTPYCAACHRSGIAEGSTFAQPWTSTKKVLAARGNGALGVFVRSLAGARSEHLLC